MKLLTTRTLKHPASRAWDLFLAAPLSALAAGLSFAIFLAVEEHSKPDVREFFLLTFMASAYFAPFAAVAASLYYAVGRKIGQLGLWQCILVGVSVSTISVASIDFLRYIYRPMLTLGAIAAISATVGYSALYVLAVRRARSEAAV